MKKTEGSIHLSNGVELSYIEQGHTNATPLILIPGLADSWRIFELLMSHFPETVHLYALSQRGHGDSSRPLSGYQTRDFEADLLLFMDALKLEQAVLVGASSGGFTARSFAADHPDRTLALTLLGCPATLKDNQAAQRVWESTISRLKDPVSRGFVEHFARDLFLGPLPADFLEMLHQESLKLPARVWRDTTQGILLEEFPGTLGLISCPTLLLWGERDTLIDPLSQQKMAQLIPNGRLIKLKEAGHMLYCEAPEETAAQIMDFIEDIL